MQNRQEKLRTQKNFNKIKKYIDIIKMT